MPESSVGDKKQGGEKAPGHQRKISWDINLDQLDTVPSEENAVSQPKVSPPKPPLLPRNPSQPPIAPKSPTLSNSPKVASSPPRPSEILMKPDMVERDVSVLSAGIPPVDENPSPGKKLWKAIKLTDVLKQSPLESEAESLLIRAMDNRDPVTASLPKLSTVNDPILNPGVDEALNENGSHAARSVTATEENPPRPKEEKKDLWTDVLNRAKRDKKNHRRQQTMENNLNGLAGVLEDIHGGIPDAVGFDESIETTLIENDIGNQGHNRTSSELHQRLRKNTITSVDSKNSEQEQSFAVDIETAETPKASNEKEKNTHFFPAGSLTRKNSSPRNRAGVGKNLLRKIPLFPELGVFVSAKQSSIRTYMTTVAWIVVPAGVISFCLFYFAGNMPTGRIDLDIKQYNGTLVNQYGDLVDPNQTSVSWWLLFVVRQLVTLSLAQAVQFFVVDFLSIGMQVTPKLLGPFPTLLIVQSHGWPFLLTVWCLLDLGMLSGSNEFADSWLFWQETVRLFNAANPSGGVPADATYIRVLIIGVVVGLVVAVKRTWMGFFFGRKTYVNYAEELSKVIRKIILLSKVASLAKEIEHDCGRSRHAPTDPVHVPHERLLPFFSQDDATEAKASDCDASFGSEGQSPFVIDPDRKDQTTGVLTDAQKSRVTKILGAWEEPEDGIGVEENISLRAILKFRQSLTFLDTPFLFSHSFGLVDSRESCIESSQEVFLRLLLDAPHDTDVLSFDTVAKVAMGPDRELDTGILKDLISLLRPDRNGDLMLIDFVKSVDVAYKRARLLRASVKNSQKIDKAFASIFNTIFYVITACIILSQLGFDPFALFLSLSSIILAFAFMIGSASAKYFEGLLFVLVQRPYDIGDRINIEPPATPGQSNGSASWIVKDVTLFTTTVVLGATNETATISNGALAQCRIINGARSPNATILVFMKFGIEVPYEKIQVFLEALTAFVKSRPRQWVALLGFRSTDIEADRGYIQYITILSHRNSWQDIGSLKASQAEVQAFTLELAKKLDMRYKSPPLPVNLSMETAGVWKPGSQDDRGDTNHDNSASDLNVAEDWTKSLLAPKHDRVSTEDFQKISSMFTNNDD